MKKTFLALAVAAAALASTPASSAIVVSMNPAVQSVAVGDTVSVDIRISGLGDEILSAFDLNVLFDGSLLGDPSSITFFLAQFGGLSNIYFQPSFDPGNNGGLGGSVLDDDALAAIQADDFVFLSFSWTALANGAAYLDFGPDLDFERNAVGRRFQTLNATYQGACVAIGTGSCDNRVPEPATYALAGLALLGCGLTTARRRRQGALAAA